MPDLFTAETGVFIGEGNRRIFLEHRTFKKYRALCLISLVLGTLVVIAGLMYFIRTFSAKSGGNSLDNVQGGSIPNVTIEVNKPSPILGLSPSHPESQNPEPRTMKVICTTKICNETALDIQNSMNLSVNPCDDFYDFACSRYQPQIGGARDRFHELMKKYDIFTAEMTDRLEGEPRLNEHPIIRHARNVYKNCLNTGYRTESTHVRHFIQKALNISEWPIQELPGGIGANYLNEKIAEFRLQLSIAPFFKIDLTLPSLEEEVIANFDITETTFSLPWVLQSGRYRNSSEYQGAFSRYSLYVHETMIEFGGQTEDFENSGDNGDHHFENIHVLKMAEEVVLFEQALYDITDSHTYTYPNGYEEFTVSDLDGGSATDNSGEIQTNTSNSLIRSLFFVRLPNFVHYAPTKFLSFP